MEGLALGAEKYLCGEYRKKESNEAFLYDIANAIVIYLQSSYVWICEELGMTFEKSLLKVKSEIDEIEAFLRGLLRKSSYHSIGNTLFYLYEQKFGNKMYRDMISVRFDFTKV